MKIFLDDVRECPAGWTLYRTAEELLSDLSDVDFYYGIEEISFDHDLGEGKKTGYDVAKFFEEAAHLGRVNYIPKWNVHSANPVGRGAIIAAMFSAKDASMKN
jgi:hypothetical protein